MPLKPDHILVDDVVGDMRRIVWEYDFVEGHVPKKGKKVFYILVGPKGAVQFAYMWHEAFDGVSNIANVHPQENMMGMDVGYHSYEPMFDGHQALDCDLLMGQDYCYYDGSGLRADPLLQMWLEADKNDEVIWMALKNEYDIVFERGGEELATTTETTQEEEDG